MKEKFIRIIIGIIVIGIIIPSCSREKVTLKPYLENIDKVKICKIDSDCIFVESSYCSCSNGGSCLSINKKFLKEWNDNLVNYKDKLVSIKGPQKCLDTRLIFKNDSKCIEGKCFINLERNE